MASRKFIWTYFSCSVSVLCLADVSVGNHSKNVYFISGQYYTYIETWQLVYSVNPFTAFKIITLAWDGLSFIIIISLFISDKEQFDNYKTNNKKSQNKKLGAI